MSAKKMGAPLRQQRDTRCHYPNDTTIVPRIRRKRKPSLGQRLYWLTVNIYFFGNKGGNPHDRL